VKDGQPAYVTYLRKQETMPMFFFFTKFRHLAKTDLPKFQNFFSVNLKNSWKIMPKFPSHKIKNPKTRNPAAKLKCVSFFGIFLHNGHIYFWENLEVFGKSVQFQFNLGIL
jgi:hypothetical protein